METLNIDQCISGQQSYYIVVIMEESTYDDCNIANNSSWWARKSLYASFKKEAVLSKRLKLLEEEKKKKIKNIENTLSNHKKQMKAKIDHYKHKTNISILLEDNYKSIQKSALSNQILRETRVLNMKTTRQKVVKNNHKDHDQEKKNHEHGDNNFKEEKNRHIKQNIEKRNRVKLMELQSKQKLTSYWDQRLNMFQQFREKEIANHLNKQKIKLNKIGIMQQKQSSLIKQLKQTKCLRSQLKDIINKEKRLQGKDLICIYN